VHESPSLAHLAAELRALDPDDRRRLGQMLLEDGEQ
jgi:hypothetical protein